MLKKKHNKLQLFVFLLAFFISNQVFAVPEKISNSSRAIFEAKASNAIPETLSLPKVETYDELVNAIRKTRVASTQRIEAFVQQEKVREAWDTGKLIDTHVLNHQRANYAEQVVIRLAKDLGTSETELRYMLLFARAYAIHPPADELSWAHYRELLSLNDLTEREEVTKEAVRQGWNRDQVREEVRRRQGSEVVESTLLEAKPGKLHTYRVVRDWVGEDKDELVVDLGFSNFYSPPKKLKFQEGDIVKLNVGAGPSARPSQGAHRGAPLQKMPNATPVDLYTYKAEVIRVLDGDTFAASVDLGFGFTTVQTLRLRGIDAPEIESAEGKEAKAFMEGEFSKAGGKILIKTVKSDKYDRYLANVWVGETYVNQKLIDEGLAVAVRD